MNAMIYIRGNKADYDGWRDEHGATGWVLRDVLPYFPPSRTQPSLTGPLHGNDGPARRGPPVHARTVQAWVDSAVAWASSRATTSTRGQTGAGLYQ